MGIFGNSPVYNPRIGAPGFGDEAPQVQPQRPGFFGKGGGWKPTLGIFSDFLAGLSGNQGIYGQTMIKRRDQELEDERWANRLAMTAAAKGQQPPTPSTAAKMAAELGFKPGTPEWQKFITRYAFTPKLVTVGNAQGGEDQVEYDPSGMGAPSTVAPGTVEDGYRFNGGDPADPNSWGKM